MAIPTTAVIFSGSIPAPPPGDQDAMPLSDGGSPAQIVAFVPRQATTSLRGTVKPDGTSITIDDDGTIHAVATTAPGGGGTVAAGGGGIWVTPSGATDGSNTQFTIPATVLAGTAYFYMRNGVGQPQLGANARYAVQGTQLTTTTPLQSDDWHEFYFVPGSAISDSGGGGSVTPTTNAVIRAVSFAANATNLALPTGSAVGDLAVFFDSGAGGGFGTPGTTPAGWTRLFAQSGKLYNGFAAWKVLTSGDISTGSVSVTDAGASPVMAMVTFYGAAGGVREGGPGTAGGGPSGVGFGFTSSSAVASGDIALYFDGDLFYGATASVPTVTPQSGSMTTGGSGTVTSSPPTNIGAVLGSQVMPGGVFGAIFQRDTEAFGAFVVVKGA